ncbi:MAG TPA: cytochrome c maturation protein CcmE [Paenirhodobacter sp.]
MKSLKKTRRIQVIAVTAVALAASTAMIGIAMRDGISYFRAPSQLLQMPPAPGEIFRLGGLVEAGTLLRGAGATVTFRVTDGGASVPVRFTGVLPDLFREGQGVVGLGQMQGATFVATEILAKHDENYMPREVIDALKAQGIYEKPKSQ